MDYILRNRQPRNQSPDQKKILPSVKDFEHEIPKMWLEELLEDDNDT